MTTIFHIEFLAGFCNSRPLCYPYSAGSFSWYAVMSSFVGFCTMASWWWYWLWETNYESHSLCSLNGVKNENKGDNYKLSSPFLIDLFLIWFMVWWLVMLKCGGLQQVEKIINSLHITEVSEGVVIQAKKWMKMFL